VPTRQAGGVREGPSPAWSVSTSGSHPLVCSRPWSWLPFTCRRAGPSWRPGSRRRRGPRGASTVGDITDLIACLSSLTLRTVGRPSSAVHRKSVFAVPHEYSRTRVGVDPGSIHILSFGQDTDSPRRWRRPSSFQWDSDRCRRLVPGRGGRSLVIPQARASGHPVCRSGRPGL
jgi:hypothetical protein